MALVLPLHASVLRPTLAYVGFTPVNRDSAQCWLGLRTVTIENIQSSNIPISINCFDTDLNTTTTNLNMADFFYSFFGNCMPFSEDTTFYKIYKKYS